MSRTAHDRPDLLALAREAGIDCEEVLRDTEGAIGVGEDENGEPEEMIMLFQRDLVGYRFRRGRRFVWQTFRTALERDVAPPTLMAAFAADVNAKLAG